MDNMTLYIPRVFANIMDKDIREVFERNYIGKIHHIDFVDKMGKDHKVYHSAYVHFEYWYDTIRARNIQHKLNQSENVRIMYDGPWYWLIYKNQTKKFGGEGIRKERITLLPLLPLLEKVVQNPVGGSMGVSFKDTMEEELVAVSLKDTMEEELVAVSLKDTMEEELVAVSLKDTMEEELVAVSLKDTMSDTSINFDDLCADFSFDELCVDFSREEINQIEINIFKEFELYIPVQ